MSGFYMTNDVVSPFVPTNGDFRDMGVRAFTGGLFGFSTAIAPENNVFVYALPVSTADQEGGGICCVTGYWAPAHRLVQTRRGRAIDNFAPNDKPGGYAR